MSGLLETKEYLKKLYSKNEAYLVPALKCIFSFIVLLIINGKLGYMDKINSVVVVLVAALFCSFMPLKVTAIVAGLFMLLHYYALALECALVVFVLYFIMFLLYIRFVPKETFVVLLTPLLFFLKIPYVIPVAMGLLGGPASIVSVTFGVIISYLVEYTELNATAITSMDSASALDRLRFIIDGIVGNKSMIITIVAFAVTLLVVYIIRRRSMDHAWTIATVSGVVTNLMILIIGDLIFDLNNSILMILFGSVLAGVIGRFLEFFAFNLDYSRTEYVQFEDDEYYYYVKAVPKIMVAEPDKKVKRINTTRTEGPVRTAPTAARTTPAAVKTAHGVSRSMTANRSQTVTKENRPLK